MVTDLLFRVACHGGGDEPLNAHLKRITDSVYTRKTLGGAEIDGQLLAPIIQESHDKDCRCEIMRHLHECLSERNGRRWQRIYGGLALTEALMQHGSPALAIEVAHGHHFDLVQKVSFLEHFDAVARGCTDRRAESSVCGRARDLLASLVPLLERASSEEIPGFSSDLKETASTGSKDAPSMSPGSTTASGSMISSTSSTTSPAFSGPGWQVASREAPIDDAFVSLSEWMHSSGSSSGSSFNGSPRNSVTSSEASVNDSDWEPIGELPAQRTGTTRIAQSPGSDKSESSDASEVFFTPMPAPAFAVPLTKPKFLMSL